MPARAQTNAVYAVKYGQPTNSFGTINLSTGSFSKIASLGVASINDIAWCSTNGLVYGISNQSVLVKFNSTNGTITTVAALSKNVSSIAFRPADGALFGATATKLFTIDPVTGKTTPVGDYGNPPKLNKAGQNIRFAQDGNLYVSNTSTNTDFYQINTSTGAAVWMGEAVGCPNVMLQNAGQIMYGVANIKTNRAELVSFNLASFVVGGTNANGSTHQITFTAAGAGTNFPANFVFSGSGLQSVSGSINPSPAPKLSCAAVHGNGGNQFIVSWQSVANQTYQLESTTNLVSGVWTSAGGLLTGNGGVLSVTNSMNGVPKRYFRLGM
jgi:hypothetical protein